MKRLLISLSLVILSLVSATTFIAFAQYVTTEEQVKKEPETPAASATVETATAVPAEAQVKKEANMFERPATAADIQKAFEKAMIELESSRRKDEERMTEELKGKLKSAVKEWADQRSKQNESDVNKLISQNWETLIRYGDPAHYDYYLREFAYTEGSSDIIKTDSITTPYKATVIITERLYVERYHTPDASDPSVFFYTFTNPMKLSLEYKDGRFVVVNTASEGIGPQLDKGWPKAIVDLWKKYGERFRERAPYGG